MKFFVALALASLAFGAAAGNYPLGTMTCDDIGAYAREAVANLDAGKSLETTLKELDERKFNDPVEKKNLTRIAYVMYDGFGAGLTPETAHSMMKYDCETGRTKQ